MPNKPIKSFTTLNISEAFSIITNGFECVTTQQLTTYRSEFSNSVYNFEQNYPSILSENYLILINELELFNNTIATNKLKYFLEEIVNFKKELIRLETLYTKSTAIEIELKINFRNTI